MPVGPAAPISLNQSGLAPESNCPEPVGPAAPIVSDHAGPAPEPGDIKVDIESESESDADVSMAPEPAFSELKAGHAPWAAQDTHGPAKAPLTSGECKTLKDRREKEEKTFMTV